MVQAIIWTNNYQAGVVVLNEEASITLRNQKNSKLTLEQSTPNFSNICHTKTQYINNYLFVDSKANINSLDAKV